MPTYDFRCPEGHEFEKFYRKISDGVLELPCPECGKIALRKVSGGAGLRLAWAILRPGDRSRVDALRLGSAQASRVMLLVIPVLGVAGLIEGFLSPSGASEAVKAAVGVATGGMLWGYVLFVGRRPAA